MRFTSALLTLALLALGTIAKPSVTVREPSVVKRDEVGDLITAISNVQNNFDDFDLVVKAYAGGSILLLQDVFASVTDAIDGASSLFQFSKFSNNINDTDAAMLTMPLNNLRLSVGVAISDLIDKESLIGFCLPGSRNSGGSYELGSVVW